ncbi:MAG: YggT family protein [bacterium]
MTLFAVKKIITGVFTLYEALIFINVILSWSQRRPAGRIWDLLDMVTEPVLGPCRDILNSLYRFVGIDQRSFPLDLSPMLALVLLDLVRRAALLGAVRLLG